MHNVQKTITYFLKSNRQRLEVNIQFIIFQTQLDQ